MEQTAEKVAPSTTDELWRSVQALGAARRALEAADRQTWGIFGLGDDDLRQHRARVATRLVNEALTALEQYGGIDIQKEK